MLRILYSLLMAYMWPMLKKCITYMEMNNADVMS